MDNTSWTAPPGAAQPTGIQSTAGAVPVMNEKGEVSMKKVKVQRYVSGKRPEYAPASSDEEQSDDEDFTRPQGGAPPSPTHKMLTDAELQDPRLRRLLASRLQEESLQEEMEKSKDKTDNVNIVTEDNRDSGVETEKETEQMLKPIEEEDDDIGKIELRRFEQAEVVEVNIEDKNDVSDKLRVAWPSHRLADSDSESEGEEIDEDELATRRLRLLQRAQQKAQQEEEVLGKEDEGSEESSEEESSEYTEESDSEEEGPRLKPVFVRKKDRVTVLQKDGVTQPKTNKQESDGKRRQEERRREILKLIEQEHRQAINNSSNKDGTAIDDVNTDDEADDAEYEAWKGRELRRLKRDKEERDNAEKEREEVDRLRNMNEEERRIDLRNNPKLITNKAVKGKYKFLQKYYHRGAFFLDEEADVYKRDFSGATLEDHFDKTILPKVMQVKNFGRSGRTKYTHLVDQDTTSFDSPWAADTQMNHKFFNGNAGGMKQSFDKPTIVNQMGGSNSVNSSNRK